MPSNDELMEALKRTKRFPRHEDCPKGLEAGAGLSGSPRQSDFGTAVILGPDDYHELLAIRDGLQSTLAADHGGETITPERLADSGWRPRSNTNVFPSVADADWFSLLISRPNGSIEATISRIGETWSLTLNWWKDRRSHWPIGLRLMSELELLLTALAIDTTKGEGR